MATEEKRKQWRANRRGRKPDAGVKRTPSGQKSRSNSVKRESEQEIMSTAIQSRIRLAAVDGEVIDEKEALSPYRGSVAGRRYLSGALGKGDVAKQRLQAGLDAAATWARCRAILGYPPLTAQAMNMGKVKGLSVEGMDLRERNQIASNTMMGFEARLGSAGNGCKTVYKEIFLNDEEGHDAPHMNAILCKALDALIM